MQLQYLIIGISKYVASSTHY